MVLAVVAVGGIGLVTKVYVVILGIPFQVLPHHREAAEAGVENANHGMG